MIYDLQLDEPEVITNETRIVFSKKSYAPGKKKGLALELKMDAGEAVFDTTAEESAKQGE